MVFANRALRFSLLAGLVLSAGLCLAAKPELEADSVAQSAADVLREAAGAEIAFLPGGMIKESYQADNLASLLLYPTDELAVVNLKGSQIRQALERSASLFPAPNAAFLQLSGVEASFSRTAAPDSRVLSVAVGSAKLDNARVYTVAMPATVARGGLGFFKIWSKDQIGRVIEGVTLESLLKGKKAGDTAPRWTVQP